MPNWFVYFLKSQRKDWLYIGFTNQVERRYGEHCRGEVQSTKSYRPLRLVGYVAVETQGKAIQLESYFKTGSGKAILRKRILSDEVSVSSKQIILD
ncbi:MAG TPA: GIY-YIG nuclease family protein [Bacteroidota bacterium]|nr:GIY-YIG nuclease family protein [Bacteroidota bacterium]